MENFSGSFILRTTICGGTRYFTKQKKNYFDRSDQWAMGVGGGTMVNSRYWVLILVIDVLLCLHLAVILKTFVSAPFQPIE